VRGPAQTSLDGLGLRSAQKRLAAPTSASSLRKSASPSPYWPVFRNVPATLIAMTAIFAMELKSVIPMENTVYLVHPCVMMAISVPRMPVILPRVDARSHRSLVHKRANDVIHMMVVVNRPSTRHATFWACGEIHATARPPLSALPNSHSDRNWSADAAQLAGIARQPHGGSDSVANGQPAQTAYAQLTR
jgi:hypothetical protein